MARKLRVEFPGGICHVINRGDRRESIFKTDEDRKLFLTCLDQCCAKTGWQVHACDRFADVPVRAPFLKLRQVLR